MRNIPIFHDLRYSARCNWIQPLSICQHFTKRSRFQLNNEIVLRTLASDFIYHVSIPNCGYVHGVNMSLEILGLIINFSIKSCGAPAKVICRSLCNLSPPIQGASERTFPSDPASVVAKPGDCDPTI